MTVPETQAPRSFMSASTPLGPHEMCRAQGGNHTTNQHLRRLLGPGMSVACGFRPPS